MRNFGIIVEQTNLIKNNYPHCIAFYNSFDK